MENLRNEEFRARYEPALTTDGHRLEVVANISHTAEAERAVNAAPEDARSLRLKALAQSAQGDLKRVKGDLAGGATTLQYAGRSYTAQQVKLDLANRFERYKTNEATLTSLQDIHAARQRSQHRVYRHRHC